MPQLQQVIPIEQILRNAMTFAIELLRPSMGVIEQQ